MEKRFISKMKLHGGLKKDSVESICNALVAISLISVMEGKEEI